MTEEAFESIVPVLADYPLAIEVQGSKMTITSDSLPEALHVDYEYDEYTIYTDSWHEHVGSAQGVKEFLLALLSGTARIVLKYRGSFLAAHKVQWKKNGEFKTIGLSGSLLSPFWRKKRIVIRSYELANSHLKLQKTCLGKSLTAQHATNGLNCHNHHLKRSSLNPCGSHQHDPGRSSL